MDTSPTAACRSARDQAHAKNIDDLLGQLRRTMEFGVARVDDGKWTKRWFDRGLVSSEPMVTRDQGGNIYLLMLTYCGRTQRSHWQVIDSQHLHTVATICVGQAIPLTFHGCWVRS